MYAESGMHRPAFSQPAFTMTRFLFIVLLLSVSLATHAADAPSPSPKPTPIKVVIAGLVHGHVGGFLKNSIGSSVEIVGICEANQEVVKRYQERFKLDEKLFGTDLAKMLDERKPQAIWVFTSTYDHLSAVEAAAPRGIHVIVEKPLAVDKLAAERMAALARQHKIQLLTKSKPPGTPALPRLIASASRSSSWE